MIRMLGFMKNKTAPVSATTLVPRMRCLERTPPQLVFVK